jgi:hypothetical protein
VISLLNSSSHRAKEQLSTTKNIAKPYDKLKAISDVYEIPEEIEIELPNRLPISYSVPKLRLIKP